MKNGSISKHCGGSIAFVNRDERLVHIFIQLDFYNNFYIIVQSSQISPLYFNEFFLFSFAEIKVR